MLLLKSGKRKKLTENEFTSIYDYNITKPQQVTTLGSYRNTGHMAMLEAHNLKSFISILPGQCGQKSQEGSQPMLY